MIIVSCKKNWNLNISLKNNYCLGYHKMTVYNIYIIAILSNAFISVSKKCHKYLYAFIKSRFVFDTNW